MEQDTGHYVEYPHPIRAGPGAIDNLAHVNNAIYLMWMQEAIGALWRKTAPLGQVKALTWVAHRHDVVYNRPAVLPDLLIAVVRVTGEDCFVVRCAFGQPADLERVVDALAAFGSVSTSLVLSHPVNKAVPLG